MIIPPLLGQRIERPFYNQDSAVFLCQKKTSVPHLQQNEKSSVPRLIKPSDEPFGRGEIHDKLKKSDMDVRVITA